MQEMSSRATETLTTIQRFFNHYLIDLYGCDYSSSGLTMDAVENKLRNFFQRVTADGPYFDTYLVYYSGHVYDNGDWALAGGYQVQFLIWVEKWQIMPQLYPTIKKYSSPSRAVWWILHY